MSHQATNWAIQQRGLKPATKLVLWMLADRHNPDFGCFPSQQKIAEDAEISRSSLNNHLNELEKRGMIRREKRIDPDTKKHKSTRYYLGFEIGSRVQNLDMETVSKNEEKPCPNLEKSRVQNLDTNPVIDKPVSITSKSNAREADLFSAEKPIKPQTERLPENWTPSDENIEAAKKLNLLDDEIKEIADDFRTYWTERTDKGSRKSARGWNAAWRNNCNRLASQYHRNRRISQQAQTNGYRQGSDIASIAARRRLDGSV